MAEYNGESLSSEEWQKKYGPAPTGAEPTVPRPSGTETVKQMVEAVTSPTTMFGLSPAEIAGGAAGVSAIGFGIKKGAEAIKQRSILKSPETIVTDADSAKPFIDVEARNVTAPSQPDYSKPAYQRAGQASPFDVQQPAPVETNPAVEALRQKSEQIKQAMQGKTPVPAPIESPSASAQAPEPLKQVIEAPQTPGQAIQSIAAQELVKAEPEVKTSKKGRPAGAKNLTSEQRQLQEAAKGINMYRNMFGFQKEAPSSAQSLAAIEATNKLISEGFEGKIPGSRDPFLNPSTDITAAGKKFYSGLPEGYRNVYIPWLEKNLHTLPPETQSHVLTSMTKGQTKDLSKIVKGLGLAGTALSAYETAFAKNPQERAQAGAGLMEAILPPGMNINEAGAPGVEMSPEVYKLGSPYYSSQEAKNYRQAKKVGAGRGIAPPSAYQR